MIGDVTVVIPNYNRTTLLARALKSVAAQTLGPSEVIVVDDCSDPERLSEIQSIIQDFKKSLNLKLIVNERNRGANYSRNRGIREASSKFVAFLDSDDLWMPRKLELQIAGIDKAKAGNSKPILSSTGRYRVDASGKIIARQFGGKALSPAKIRESNFIGTLSSVVVETWVARHIYGFDERLPACQDWDFFIRLSDYVNYVGVPEPLCIYVDHAEERITLNNKKRLRAHIFIYRSHIKPAGLTAFSQGEFYRNIAEDYQELGNSKKAAQFFGKYMALSKAKRKLISRLVPPWFWHLYYRWRDAPAIKESRYRRYAFLMSQMMNNPVHRLEMERDGAFIEQMMTFPR